MKEICSSLFLAGRHTHTHPHTKTTTIKKYIYIIKMQRILFHTSCYFLQHFNNATTKTIYSLQICVL